MAVQDQWKKLEDIWKSSLNKTFIGKKRRHLNPIKDFIPPRTQYGATFTKLLLESGFQSLTKKIFRRKSNFGSQNVRMKRFYFVL